MNVLHLVPDLHSPGGIQEFAKSAKGALGVRHDFLDWPQPRLKRVRTSLSVRFNQLSELREQENRKPDILHHWHISSAALSMAAPRTPELLTCHGTEILESETERLEKRLLWKRAIRRIEHFVANSAFTRRYLSDHHSVNVERISIITPGVSIEVPMRVKAGSSVTHVGTLCRLVERKNVGTVIDAVTSLRATGREFHFHLGGDGPLREELLHHLRRAGIQWTYWGRLSDADKKNKFYPNLDVFVLPTLKSQRDVEGFGIVYLEANAAGVPVVGTRWGGVEDAISHGKSGFLVAEPEIELICKAISDVVDGGSELRVSARAWAERNSLEAMNEKFSKLYSER